MPQSQVPTARLPVLPGRGFAGTALLLAALLATFHSPTASASGPDSDWLEVPGGSTTDGRDQPGDGATGATKPEVTRVAVERTPEVSRPDFGDEHAVAPSDATAGLLPPRVASVVPVGIDGIHAPPLPAGPCRAPPARR